MPIIKPPPDDIFETKLLQILRNKCCEDGGLFEKVRDFIEVATPLVDLIISGPFSHYTLHNRDHAKKLIHLTEYTISPYTLEKLSPLESVIIIYSAFLHDMGMALTSTERDRIIRLPEFDDTIRGLPQLWGSIQEARKNLQSATSDDERRLLELQLFQLNEVGLAAYLRPKHATNERYQSLIGKIKKAAKRDDLFEVRGDSFENYLIKICVSHNSDAGVLSEVKDINHENFPRGMVIGGQKLNTQFCAGVLRLIDILDFDRERTPSILFESLGIAESSIPGAEVSLREWSKHMAVHTLEKKEDEIIVFASCNHPVIEKTVKDFCQEIEREIRDTCFIIKNNRAEISDTYSLDIPIKVRPQITSIGYTYTDMSLKLNQTAIVSLLMGDRLYSNSMAAARELIQNAIDACSARASISDEKNYLPKIKLNLSVNNDIYWLEVIDNGIGMDEHVLSEYFLTLGNSYYGSAEFQRTVSRTINVNNFHSIARFGIGIASIFLLANFVEIKTKRFLSPRKDDKCRIVRIEKFGSLAYVCESDADDSGTTIKIKLLPEVSNSIKQFSSLLMTYLSDIILHPQYDIDVSLLDKVYKISKRKLFYLRTSAKDILKKIGLEAFEFDLERWSDNLTGKIVLILCQSPNGKYSYLQDKHYIRIGHTGVDPVEISESYGGNILTVNGFKMKVPKIHHLVTGKSNRGQSRLALLFEIDARGNKDINYDIARNKIIGEGRMNLALWILEALKKGLIETGVWDKMDQLTQEVFLNRMRSLRSGNVRKKLIDDKELLNKIQSILPSFAGEDDLPKKVANFLKININLTAAVINILREKNEINV